MIINKRSYKLCNNETFEQRIHGAGHQYECSNCHYVFDNIFVNRGLIFKRDTMIEKCPNCHEEIDYWKSFDTWHEEEMKNLDKLGMQIHMFGCNVILAKSTDEKLNAEVRVCQECIRTEATKRGFDLDKFDG